MRSFLPRRLILSSQVGRGTPPEGGLGVRLAVWSGCKLEGTGQQVGKLANFQTVSKGKLTHGAGEQAWAQQLTTQEVTPVSSELEGLKGHVSLQREEVEAQTHLGTSPSTELKPGSPSAAWGHAVSPPHQDPSLPSPSLTSGSRYKQISGMSWIAFISLFLFILNVKYAKTHIGFLDA